MSPTRIETTILAIVRAAGGQPLADRALRRFAALRPAATVAIEQLHAAGLLCGGDDPEFPVALTAHGCFQQPPDLLGHACHCCNVRVAPCERRWPHNKGWCGACSHQVSCHNSQPDPAEVAAYLVDPMPAKPPTSARSSTVMF